MIDPASLYASVGGMPFFARLSAAFYRRVAADPVLLPLYPEPGDLDGAAERLQLFLAQYFGGPTTYMETRGHPRLRMRHQPYRIGATERDHWLVCMAGAVEEVVGALGPIGSEVRSVLMSYFVPAAEHLRNDGPLEMRPA